MKRLEKILCIVDPTTNEHPVVERAAWLAKLTGASIELRICFYDQFLSGGRLFDSRSLAKAREEVIEVQQRLLNEIRKNLASDGVTAAASAVWDHPLDEAIVRSAIETGADLVMKDTHHHSHLDISTLANTDWGLIRTCPVPLWLVKPHSDLSPLKVLAAVDPTHEHDKPADLDHRIISIGNELADTAGGELHVFHAVDTQATLVRTSPDIAEPTFMIDSDVLERMREFHRDSFETLTEDREIPTERRHFVEGNVHEALPNTATNIGAGVVVMGAVSRGLLQRVFIGSTAEQTLDRLSSDLLIVKPSDFETPVETSEGE